MPETRIGISGWSYRGWQGPFYPKDLPQKRHLEYASRQFNSIEINGSFYSLQTPQTYRRWYEETPEGFVFAVKGSRFITHTRRLGDAETPLANFFASGLLLLRDKLGPLLWQVPANFRYDRERLRAFAELLPRDTEEAVELARKHDQRVKGREWVRTDHRRRLRHAIEIRNETFLNPEFVRLLRDHNIAIVFSDAPDWPYTEELTAGFAYLRLHGSRQTYASRYTDRELDRWAKRISSWRSGAEPSDAHKITDRKPPARQSRDVYVYFDNDQMANAPKDAGRLANRLGIQPLTLPKAA